MSFLTMLKAVEGLHVLYSTNNTNKVGSIDKPVESLNGFNQLQSGTTNSDATATVVGVAPEILPPFGIDSLFE